MRIQHRWVVGVLLWMSALGCSATRNAEQPSTPAAEQHAASTASPPPPDTAPQAPECAGSCYRNLPNGGCESMPTCCPRTVHFKAPPHCPAEYTLDLQAGPERCAVRHLCVD